jgi:glycosyltransferase 2 family protein
VSADVSPEIDEAPLLRALGAHKVFGTVPRAAVRRHPSEFVRFGLAFVLTVLTAIVAREVSVLTTGYYNLLANVPGDIRDFLKDVYVVSTVTVVVVLLVVGIVVRRPRIVLAILGSLVLALVVSFVLRSVIDAESVRTQAGMTSIGVPTYPAVLLAAATAVVLAVGGYFTRPTRRVAWAAIIIATFAAMAATIGMPTDIVGAMSIAAGVAALARLAVGSPSGTPSTSDVAAALAELGVTVTDLHLTPEQSWGEVDYAASDADGRELVIAVLGRDARHGDFFAMLWRFVWYKDTPFSFSFGRGQQLEHRGYILLLARQAGLDVASVVAAGIAGAKSDALLVTADPAGTTLADLDEEQLSDDVLDATWRAGQRLHATRLSHGSMGAHNVLLLEGGGVALVGLRDASTSPTADQQGCDRAELLTTTALVVGAPRALQAAQRVLGPDGLANLLPLLEPTALSPATRRAIKDHKHILGELREQGAELAGVDKPELTGLQRIKISSVVMAAATMLGVYLLFGELAGVDFEAVVTNAQWDWIALAALLSQLPQFAQAVAMTGSVATPLPLRITTVVQFANAFTGLVAGTAGNVTLVVRYFERQGKPPAVAVSSGMLNSLAGFATQLVLVGFALIVTAGDYSTSTAGGDASGAARLVLLMVLVVGIVLTVTITIPKLRKWAWTRAKPQAEQAWANLRTIASMPRKAVQMFGGNLVSQLLFALTLDACLHAYGGSLPFMQIVLVNTFASFIGGAVPVPGGMGVVEAGLIGGLTAAGVPQDIAVAATFTHRLLTAYLPPIWGWFALRWLRQRSYV